jgi:uncharacterized protein YuzE
MCTRSLKTFTVFRHGYAGDASAEDATAFIVPMCDTDTIIMQVLRMTCNRDANAAYSYLRERVQVARTRNLDGVRLIDYAEDGAPVGIELLDVSDGVNLDGLPRRDEIESLLAERHIPMFA